MPKVCLISLKFIVQGRASQVKSISKFGGLVLKKSQRFMCLFPWIIQQATSSFEPFNQEENKDTLS